MIDAHLILFTGVTGSANFNVGASRLRCFAGLPCHVKYDRCAGAVPGPMAAGLMQAGPHACHAAVSHLLLSDLRNLLFS